MAAFDANAAFNKEYTKQQVQQAHNGLWKYPDCIKHWKLPLKPPYQVDALKLLTPDVLQKICKIWGLAITGNKDKLAKRIFQAPQHKNISWASAFYTKQRMQQQQQQQQQQKQQQSNLQKEIEKLKKRT